MFRAGDIVKVSYHKMTLQSYLFKVIRKFHSQQIFEITCLNQTDELIRILINDFGRLVYHSDFLYYPSAAEIARYRITADI